MLTTISIIMGVIAPFLAKALWQFKKKSFLNWISWFSYAQAKCGYLPARPDRQGKTADGTRMGLEERIGTHSQNHDLMMYFTIVRHIISSSICIYTHETQLLACAAGKRRAMVSAQFYI
jgi:hypothetical protein